MKHRCRGGQGVSEDPLEHKGVQVGSALRAPLPGQSSPGLDWPLTS